MAKQIMAQLVMVKLIIMAKFIMVRPTIVNLTMVKLFIVSVRWFFCIPYPTSTKISSCRTPCYVLLLPLMLPFLG